MRPCTVPPPSLLLGALVRLSLLLLAGSGSGAEDPGAAPERGGVMVDGEWAGVLSVAGDTDLCSPGRSACGRYDAVVILGGGPQGADGLPPPFTRSRLDAAVEIDRCCPPEERVALQFITTSFGTAHVPNPNDPQGFPISEAQASAAYLMRRGIEGRRVFMETVSWDTIGNAVFTKLLHTNVRGWHRLLLVTSDFHMPRSRAIFEWILGIPEFSERESLCDVYTLGVLGVADVGMEEEVLAHRREREGKSLLNVHKLASRLKDMSQVHEWLYSQHDTYTAGGSVKRLQGGDRAMYGGTV